MERRVVLAVAAALALLHAAPASGATVAVLPFVDLADARGAVGEAIRETMTSDLRGVVGLKVVERGRIDDVLREQRLAARADLDVPRAAQIGRLVGATLIATGAYQRAGGSIRLTARFVDVESGVIVSTAKVDGAAGDFLQLQDRVTSELVRSAGFSFPARRRPRLHGLHAVETYGEALLEHDVERRRVLLRAAADEEPDFVYAARDLDALAQRLPVIAAHAEAERSRIGLARIDALAGDVAAARTAEERAARYGALFDALHEQLRFRRLLEEAERVVDRPPLPVSTPAGARLDERARFEEILGLCILKRHIDRVLAQGERFLARYPTSRHFGDVQRFMEYAIRWKRKAEQGPGNAEARIAALPPQRRDDPCQVGHVYHEERQLRRAAESYEKCVAARTDDQNSLMNLMNVYIAIPDFAAARRTLARIRERFPGLAEGPQGEGWREIPIDAD